MIDMLKRHEIQVLRRAGHSQSEVATLAGVSRRSVQRVDTEAAVTQIDAARERTIYDDLILGDLETVLSAPGRSYDLIVSADTMVYLGDVAPAFFGVANRLESGGFYLFACEAKDGEGWEQTPENRFRHSERYLRKEAAHAGLSFVDLMECSLRRERDQPIRGYAVALHKGGRPVSSRKELRSWNEITAFWK